MKAAMGFFICIMFPIVAAAQSTLNFPRVIQPQDFTGTGFAIVNPSSTSASTTFTLYGRAGTVTKATTLTIPSGGQLARLASELFAGIQTAGWVQVTSSVTGLQGFWFGGDFATFADGSEAASSSAELVLPLAATKSEINVANTGASDVTMTIRLLDVNGYDLADPKPERVPPKGFLSGSSADLFPSADLNSATHMKLKCGCAAPGPFAGVIIARDFIGIGPSWSVVNAIPSSTATRTIYFPHLVEGPQSSFNWRSILGVTNLSSEDNTVMIQFTSDSGVTESFTQTIQPNGAIRDPARNLFASLRTGAFQNGWLRVTSTSSLPITGYVVFAETTQGGVAAVPPQSEPQSNLLFNHIADLPPWFTGLALLNPNPIKANIDIFAMTPGGSLIGTKSIVLGPGLKTAQQLSELIPQTQTRTDGDGGFVFVRSDQPLFGIELFYSRDLQILSNVAAGRILPGITYVPPSGR